MKWYKSETRQGQRDVKQNKIMTFIDRSSVNAHKKQNTHSFEVLAFKNQCLLVWIGKKYEGENNKVS